jgi:hypothetical protein
MKNDLRMRRRLMRSAGLLPLVLLAACAAPVKPPATTAPRVIEAPGKAAVAVTEADDGARIVVERAQTLVVSLAVAGNQNPDWSVVDLKPGVLTLAGSKFERALRNTNVEEAAGSTVFRFRPEAPGELLLKFELRRPYGGSSPLQSVAYVVTVK